MTAKLTYLRWKAGSSRGREGTLLAALCIAVAAWIIAGSIALAADFGRSEARHRTIAAQEAAGVFTGAFLNGVPVYRLPSLTVVGHRDAELAGEMRDTGRAPALRVEAYSVSRPCPHVAQSRTLSVGVRVL
jgi:hypothetical protein